MAELEHGVICGVHDVVNGGLPERLQALTQPIRRGLHFHAAQDARREPAAKIRGGDLHACNACSGVACFTEVHRYRWQRVSPERGHLARYAVMAETVRAIDGEVEIEQGAGGRL